MIEHLSFRPFPGLSSPHLQTVVGTFSRAGEAPLSTQLLVRLEDGDTLCCELSTPLNWTGEQKTVLMVHGLGGSHASSYMIRLSRHFFQKGYRVVRINLRGCGSGKTFARLPYHGGVSQDVYRVIQTLKQQTPHSPFILIGFSLGGNIALKLAGECQTHQESLLQHVIAVCPPVDLARTLELLNRRSNHLYHRYYLKHLRPIAKRWADHHKIASMYEFDNKVTAKAWGFKNAEDYYQQASSCFYLPHIKQSCQILFAMDDPFIDYQSILKDPLPSSVKVSLCKHGGHMGFIGRTEQKRVYFWMDELLQKWVDEVR